MSPSALLDVQRSHCGAEDLPVCLHPAPLRLLSCSSCSLHQQQVVAQLRTALSTLTTVSERRDELEERVQTQDRMVADVREAVKELRGVLEKRGHSFSKVCSPRASLIQP
jgi:hypothetical protein